eukprot:CCRYP_020979-RA/>CCRYP_020979-RA protein AED:0.34 eAED:0.30 QI:0/0/0/0.5/0/0/2/0/355
MQEESAIDTSACQEEMNLYERLQKDKKINASLKTLKDQYSTQLVKSTELLCKDGKISIPKDLQHLAVSWYRHYLRHPGHTRLKETLCAAMYWKGMQNTIRKYVKNCHACQVNKRHKHKYGKLPTTIIITNPWEVLCVDLIGPYTIKGKCETVIDFLCLTMIDPASSWFEIVELPVITEMIIPLDTKGRNGTKTHEEPKLAYFDKSSALISNLVNKTWFSRYPHCQYIIDDNGREFKLHFKALCESYGIMSKPSKAKNPQENAILEQVHRVISSMLRTAEIDVAPSVEPSNVDTFVTQCKLGPYAQLTTQYQKPPQVQPFLDETCCSFPSWLTGTKFENIDNTKQTKTQNGKIAHN